MTESITQKELAHRLGDITTRQVRNLTKQGVISRNDDNSYPWPRAQKEYVRFKQNEEMRRKGRESGKLIDEQARKTAVQADKLEMELAILRGDYMALDEAEAELRKIAEQVDAALRNAPGRHASTLAAKAKMKVPKATRILEELIEDVRKDLRALAETEG